VIMGEFGTIEVEVPVNASPDHPNRFTVNVTGKKPKLVEMPVVDQYQLQAEDFGKAIRKKRRRLMMSPMRSKTCIYSMRFSVRKNRVNGKWSSKVNHL